MCIAIHKPPGEFIPENILRQCWENNPDGAGYMYVRDGQVIIRKGYFDCDKFIADYFSESAKIKTDIILHFRIGTSGLLDEINCHPHAIRPDLAFCHNGVFSNITVPENSPVSDTVIFGRDILSNLPENFLNNHAILKLLEDAIGRLNKIIFLDGKGAVQIINRQYGIEYLGCWFSNSTYEKPKFSYKEFSWTDYSGDCKRCEVCKKKLSKDLRGLSSLCWECLDAEISDCPDNTGGLHGHLK